MKCPRCGGSGDLPDASVHVGDMIRLQREARGWTQQILAERVGRSRAQVANLESGRSDIPVSGLQKFAAAFGCPMKDLCP